MLRKLTSAAPLPSRKLVPLSCWCPSRKQEGRMCHFSLSAEWILLACDTLNFPHRAYLQTVVFRLQWNRLTCCIPRRQPCVYSQLQKQSVFKHPANTLLKMPSIWGTRLQRGISDVFGVDGGWFFFFFFDVHEVKHELVLPLGSLQTSWRLRFRLVKWILFILKGDL